MISKNKNKVFQINLKNIVAIYYDYISETGELKINSVTPNINITEVSILFF